MRVGEEEKEREKAEKTFAVNLNTLKNSSCFSQLG